MTDPHRRYAHTHAYTHDGMRIRRKICLCVIQGLFLHYSLCFSLCTVVVVVVVVGQGHGLTLTHRHLHDTLKDNPNAVATNGEANSAAVSNEFEFAVGC